MAGDANVCGDDDGSGGEADGTGEDWARIWCLRVCIRARKALRSTFHDSRMDVCMSCSEMRTALLVAKVASRVSMRSDIEIVGGVSGEGGIDEFCVEELVRAGELVVGFCVE